MRVGLAAQITDELLPVGWLGFGTSLPEVVVSSADLAQRLGVSEQWILERTGIRERRHAPPGLTGAALAAEALRKACRDAGLEPSDLEALFVATCTPDTIVPSTACWTLAELGLSGLPAVDVSAACSGFVSALELAAAWQRQRGAGPVGVCGVEVFSRFLDAGDAGTSVLFGDGAGALILGPGTSESGILAVDWGSDGGLAPALQIPAGGSRLPASRATVEEGLHVLRMDGRRIFKEAVAGMSASLLRTLERAALRPEQVDLFVPHQANRRIMDACCARVGVPPERLFSIVEHYGNLGAASIPVALAEAKATGRLRGGETLALAACGAGLTWASMLVRA